MPNTSLRVILASRYLSSARLIQPSSLCRFLTYSSTSKHAGLSRPKRRRCGQKVRCFLTPSAFETVSATCSLLYPYPSKSDAAGSVFDVMSLNPLAFVPTQLGPCGCSTGRPCASSAATGTIGNERRTARLSARLTRNSRRARLRWCTDKTAEPFTRPLYLTLALRPSASEPSLPAGRHRGDAELLLCA